MKKNNQISNANISFELKELKPFLSQQNYSKVVILVDQHTHKYCLPILQKQLVPFIPIIIKIKAGEEFKNIDVCEQIWNQFLKINVDRKAVLINLGGGVITDLGGFAASVYKRGIDFIHIPTSLLAMVDAAIGGKTGIDYKRFKNIIGSFNLPKGVFIHTGFLATLPQNQLLSGWAEMLKHGLIADKNYFDELLSCDDIVRINAKTWLLWIQKSIHIKNSIVEKDPYEKGVRKVLNFGHTIGHAIESYYLLNSKNPLLHGEAVAYGMLEEAKMSVLYNGLSKPDFLYISYGIEKYFSPILERILKDNNSKSWKHLMKQDKKNEQEQFQFTFLNAIGNAKHNCDIAWKELL